MKNCNCHSEMQRDGSGQLGRYLNALDPSYVLIDCRSMEDLLVFAKRYAAQIRFYDMPESTIQETTEASKVSWYEFFRRDMAVIASSISVVDLAKLKQDYDRNREALEVNPNATTLNDLFDPILWMVVQIDHWYSLAIPENPLHTDLDLAINSTLREQVRKIIAYEEAYKFVDTKHPLHLDFSAIDNSTLWGLDEAIDPDSSIYEGSTLGDNIRSAALYVDDIFHTFYGFMTDLVEVKATGYMHFALESYPSHQPHMALFITFLELFRLAQEQMNGLTGRMLDFYYQDVLRLAPKPSIADRVHIVFELAKDVTGYDLAQATALKAGKDGSGKEQIYVTETDLVINQAKVRELKTVFVQKSAASASASASATIESIYARPVANSHDGFGEKGTDPSGKWPTFGKGTPGFKKTKNICQKIEQEIESASRKDQAQIGFAIASPQLLLQGGNRLIIWRINGLKELLHVAEQAVSFDLDIWLTGENGWLQIADELDEKEFTKLIQVETFGIFDTTLPATSGYFVDLNNGSICIYLPIAANAIVPFDAKVHAGYSYATSYPVVQLMLAPYLGIDLTLFKKQSLHSQSLSVRVGSIKPSFSEEREFLNKLTDLEKEYFNGLLSSRDLFDGLKTVVLQNETGLLSANKPFDPFTQYPDYGKSFYVGSNEIFNKPLSQLAVNIRKTKDPEFNDTENSNLEIDSEVGVVVGYDYSVSVLSGKQWDQLSTESGSMQFSRQNLTQNILYHATDKKRGEQFLLGRKPLYPVTEFKSDTIKGFIRITNLRPVIYRDHLAAIQESQNMAAELQIKELSVSYYSKLIGLDPVIEQFFHVYPFGVTEVLIDIQQTAYQQPSKSLRSSINKSSPYLSLTQGRLHSTVDKAIDSLVVNANGSLLPQFTWLSPNAAYQSAFSDQTITRDNLAVMEAIVREASGIKGGNSQYSGLVQEEGMLFIGLEKLRPLDTLSLLFQFAEGSAEDEDNDPPAIHWSYLTNNVWRPLKGENLISDGTFGFQTTGIIKLEVPEDSTDHNTIITDGLRWFCASVTENSKRIPMLVKVVAQAVEASFQDNDNDQSHFDKALPAGTIGKLAVSVAQVSKVEQPFASFDGKHQEVGKEFYTRVSERLRHKARAITPWDYEHLVLDRFPSIYKVKCITHTDPNCLCRTSSLSESTCCGPQIAPGHLLIVPIANLKNRNAENPLQPKTSRRTLLEIQDYLGKRTSPFVHVHAKNPVYEQVLVFFKVQFIAGSDKGYYLKKLNDEIVHYLTPWAFDENAEISFAQKFYASAIINFIEERSYVDFITDFFMFVCRDNCCPTAKITVSERVAGTSTNIADLLASVSGCRDMEELIVSNVKFIGEVIAEPSTVRSILVSAPKHIIIPYEPPVELSACEKRKKALAQ